MDAATIPATAEVVATLCFDVPGEPRGKGRPRAVRRGQHIRMHTDDKTVSYEARVALAARAAMGDRALLEGPLACLILAHYAIPASWSKRRQASAVGAWRTGKPDADNVAKIITDGLNGVAYADDRQIACLGVWQRYALIPGVTVTITPLTTGENNG